MFIIFGTPRSGTTLLASTLNLNDQVIIPDETDFIVPAAIILERVKDPVAGKNIILDLIVSTERFKYSIGKYLSKEDIHNAIQDCEYSLPNIISAIYHKIAEKSGKSIAGDKSPNDLTYMTPLLRAGLFNGDIKIIHLIRDVRGAVLSFGNTYWTHPGDETAFIRSWNNSNLRLHNLMRNNTEYYLLIKYEDMITSPPETLNKMTDFLGVPFQDKMLDHDRRALNYNIDEHQKNIKLPFIKEKIIEWKKELSADLRDICEKEAHAALKTFGYMVNKKRKSTGNIATTKEKSLMKSMHNKDKKIIILQGKIKELESWGKKLDIDIAQKDKRLTELQKEVQELGSWGKSLDKEIAEKDRKIIELQQKPGKPKTIVK